MPEEFSTIVPMIFINRERVGGKLPGTRHIAVWIDGVGRFTLDDDEQLREMTFPKHVLEYRNETEWEKCDPAERRTIKEGYAGRSSAGASQRTGPEVGSGSAAAAGSSAASPYHYGGPGVMY